MHLDPQFGMRENPASDRRHGSRAAAEIKSRLNYVGESNLEALRFRNIGVSPPTDANVRLHAATHHVATVEKSGNDSHLLTVHEVAKLLRVPVSWVYGRTRKRSLDRLPGYRLGKYWRFREEEIHAWVKRQGGGFCGS